MTFVDRLVRRALLMIAVCPVSGCGDEGDAPSVTSVELIGEYHATLFEERGPDSAVRNLLEPGREVILELADGGYASAYAIKSLAGGGFSLRPGPYGVWSLDRGTVTITWQNVLGLADGPDIFAPESCLLEAFTFLPHLSLVARGDVLEGQGSWWCHEADVTISFTRDANTDT